MRPMSEGSDVSSRSSFLRTTPAKKPRTECGCQPVAFVMDAIVAPLGARSMARTAACLLPVRSIFGALCGEGSQAPVVPGTVVGKTILFARATLGEVLIFEDRVGVSFLRELDMMFSGYRSDYAATTEAPPRLIRRQGKPTVHHVRQRQ